MDWNVLKPKNWISAAKNLLPTRTVEKLYTPAQNILPPNRRSVIRTEREILRDFGWRPLLNARFDEFAPMPRMAYVAASRYFAFTNPVYVRLLDLAEMFVIGIDGLYMVPSAKNERFNNLARKRLKSWWNNCDVSSDKDFGELQGTILNLWLKDGECFIILENDPQRRIRICETQEIASPTSTNVNTLDGIEYDSNLRPVAYWVRDALGENYRKYPAEQVIHIYTQLRPRQLRGMPYCYSILRHLDCIQSIIGFEMKTAEKMCSKVGIVTTENGEAPDPVVSLKTFALKGTTTPEVSEEEKNFAQEAAKRAIEIEKAYGSEVVYMKPNEKFNEFVTARPSDATINLYNILVNEACIGFGIGKMGVLSESMQGTTARYGLELDNTFTESHSKMLCKYFTRIYRYAISNIPASSSDWDSVKIQTPRKMTVDIGRDSNKTINEQKHGLSTLADDYSARGQDWREQIEQIGIEAEFVAKVAAEHGLNPEDMLSRFLNKVGNGGSVPKEAYQQQNEKEEPAKPQPQKGMKNE